MATLERDMAWTLAFVAGRQARKSPGSSGEPPGRTCGGPLPSRLLRARASRGPAGDGCGNPIDCGSCPWARAAAAEDLSGRPPPRVPCGRAGVAARSRQRGERDMGLIEKRLIKQGQDEWVPAAQSELRE